MGQVKSISRAQSSAPKIVSESFLYFFVYEHLVGGLVRTGNYVTYLVDKREIDHENDLQSIANALTASGKVDVQIKDWKPLRKVKLDKEGKII